jgi:hypothetical protein
MRPRSLDEFIGQSHILGPGQLLRRAIESDRLQSLIFYGPPGTGKTSLARIIALQTRNKFERLSGVESNVSDMRRVLSAAGRPVAVCAIATGRGGPAGWTLMACARAVPAPSPSASTVPPRDRLSCRMTVSVPSGFLPASGRRVP